MHPSRLAKFIARTTMRCLALKHLPPSSLRMLPTSQLKLNLHSSIKFGFSSRDAAEQVEEEVELGKEFSEFITDQAVLNRLQQQGITRMFPIQEETFKMIEMGKDVLASDRTGSGKTLGYTLPVLQKFNKLKYNTTPIKAPKFLILCPTRELVLQVSNEINKVNTFYKVVSVYGGSSIERQMTQISRGVAIVVATPGRLIDLLERRALKFNDLEVVCIDEADTMLEKGFKDDVQEIFGHIRGAAGKTQNIMFSATIPSWVAKIARDYFDKDMQRVNMIRDDDVRTSQTVEHYALYIKRNERHSAIRNLINKYNPNNRTIIFTQTKMEANDFIKEFDNQQIVILHGDIPQNVREANLRDFRNGAKKVLIATDVAARGIDIPDVELIIQLSPPENPEPYIHRSGRTGRAGKEGINITFFDESNVHDLIEIEQAANIKIKVISNNYNISFWQAKLKKLHHKIERFEPSKDQSLYEHFLQDLLKTTNPQQALLYLIKQYMGKSPEGTSILTNKKGYVTYIAYPNQGKSADLSSSFSGINISNETPDKDGIKFDVAMSDFYKFEEMINQQEDFEVEALDENSKMTLSLFAKKYGKRGSSFNHRSRDHDRRGSFSENNEERFNRHDRDARRDREYRSEKHKQKQRFTTKRESNLPPEGLSVYKVFFYGFSPSINEIDLKENIIDQTEITDFKAKIIRKLDEFGNPSKTFGFIEFGNREDCITFLESTINVNGDTLKKRIAEDR